MQKINRRNFIKGIGMFSAGTALMPIYSYALHSRLSFVNGYVDAVKNDVLEWMETVLWDKEGWGRFKYNFHMMRDYALESSAMAFENYLMLDMIASIPAEKKKQAISFFQQCQDPKDQFFKDPLLTEEDRASDHHTWEHNWAHMSGAAINALNILGSEPLYNREKPPFAELTVENVEQWVRGLDWSNPWMVGEHFSRNIKGYWNNLPENEKTLDNPVIVKAYKVVEDEVIDPDSGLPEKRGCNNRAVAMAGLFKIMFSYLAIDKQVPCAEKAIDAVLQLQHKNGEFGEGHVGNDMCINWDSLWVLYNLNNQLDYSYRFSDIKTAGNKMAEFLLKVHRKSDGGFSFHKGHCQLVHNSFKISEKYKESDMQGVKMSLKCLQYADKWNTI